MGVSSVSTLLVAEAETGVVACAEMLLSYVAELFPCVTSNACCVVLISGWCV